MDEEHGKDDNSAIKMSQDPSSDYILVSTVSTASAAENSLWDRYGTHVLIWLCLATCLWGAILIIVVGGIELFPNLLHSGDVTMDGTAVVCIPFLMLWATASMWASYRKKNYCLALGFSIIPVALVAWICVCMGI